MNRTTPVTAIMQSTDVPDIVARARAFAVTKHGGQLRKYSDEPYVVHLDAVVGILRSFGITAPAVLGAAYLHDTVEDTEATIQDIFDSFGEQIAELVYWLTDAEQGRRRMRKTMSAWRLGRAPWDAKMIKLADLIDNTPDICRKDRHFAPVYLRENRKIMGKMVEAEGARLTTLPIFREASRIMGLPR
jgi:GTP diphosphokinase / guanosine-3',5'-bis(diphosphate) 3'-diphosphatase